MKKRWLIVTLLFGVLALSVTGVALAQTSDTSGDTPFQSFAARVAAILGLDEAKVQDAFNQAAREIRDEAVQQRLTDLVEQGTLTQGQADDIAEWYEARPDVLAPGLGLGGRGPGRGMMRGGGWGICWQAWDGA